MLPVCPNPVWTTRNQVSFVTGLHSYLIQPVAKIHFIALEPPSPLGKGDVTAQKELFRSLNRFTVQTSFTNPFYARVVSIPQAPGGGCSKAARTGTSSFHPSASYGCYATALGARVSASAPERAFYLGSPLIPQHHGARIHRAIMFRGGLPRAACCCRQHSVGWYGLNAARFSSGQSPEFTGLLSGN